MILLTGATGTVGAPLVDALRERDDVRALVRDPGAAARLERRGVQVVIGSFGDADALRRAAAGSDRLFLLSPAGVDDMITAQVAVIDAARAMGVRHVVKLSSIGADEATHARIIQAHRAIERHVEDSGFDWTHLRAHWFMQNELAQAGSVAERSEFHAPDVFRIAPVDARDVAAAAARILTEPGHEGRAYVLTGPQALSYADMAAAYSRVLGRDVRWTQVTLDEARSAMVAGGLPESLAAGFAEVMERYRAGGSTTVVSPHLEGLLGRPARTFETFVHDHRTAFRAQAVAA